MKKGFTLVELIAVIVLLSLIALFTFPSINKTIKDRKESLYNIQIDNIKASAVSYVDKNELLKDNDKVIVTLCQLKQSGFTDEKIKNPINNKYIPDDSKVIVTKDERKFIYGTDGSATCTANDTTLFEYVEIGSEYKETIDASLYTTTIYCGNNIVDKIDTTKLNTYFIEYENSNNKINKYVYIIDTTEPNIFYKDKVNGSKEIGQSTITVEASQGIFIPYDITVSDNSGEIIEPIISSNVNLRISGSYYVTYKASDSSGNTIIKTQVIKVVDTTPPVVEGVSGNPNNKTSMSVVISVNAYDNGVGLHPLGAYSFDGGKTWQVSNSITVDNNTTLNIVVRDAASNQTKYVEKITNILKDDKNISFTIESGDLKNNGWFTSDVEVLIKPLVSNEYFESFSYCMGNDICTPDKTSTNYDGISVKISEDTSGTLICGRVNKKDNTKTDIICSILFKIDKSIPDVRYEVISGKQNNGYEAWYVSDVNLAVKTSSVNGIEKIEYCTTTENSCTPNKTAYGSDISVILSTNSKTNKVCSIVTNNAGTRGQNTCSINYQIDKTEPNVNLVVNGGVDDYIGKNATIKAEVNPSTTISGYTYIWYKNDVQIQSGSSDTIIISNGDNIYKEDIYSVVVITGTGNKGESSKKVKVDTVKPTCSLTANGTNGNNGWFISNSVNVIGTFKDSESGVDNKGVGTSYGYNSNTSYSISSNTQGTTIYCSVKDKVGNEGSNSITIKKDDGSDSVCSLSGENSSWTNDRVLIEYTLTNKISGISDEKKNVLNAISTINEPYVDSGAFWVGDDDTVYGLMAEFYSGGPIVYKTMSFDSWTVSLNSGAKASCPAKTVNVYYDGVEPTCSFDENTPNGNNGWYKSNTDITATFTDSDGSGIDSKGVSTLSNTYNDNESYTLTQNTSGTTLYCSVKDKAGNVGTNSITVKKDDGSSGSCYLSGENTTWTNKQVVVSYRMNDSLSGIDTSYNGDSKGYYRLYGPEGYVELQALFQTEGHVAKTITFPSWTWRTNSGAMITCPSKTANVYYDNEKPTCSINVSGTLGTNGWYKSAITAKLTTSDGNGSGIAGYSIGAINVVYKDKDSLTFGQVNYDNLIGNVEDKVGNTNTCTYGTLKADKTVPEVTVSGKSGSGSITSGTWTNSNVTLTCNVTPSSTLSGFSYAWLKDGSNVGSTQSITVSSSGNYVCRVTTGAGNTSSSASFSVKIDKTKPTCIYSGENTTWTNSYVTINIGCNDSESGCLDGEKSLTIIKETKTSSLTTTIRDNAGNSTVCSKIFNVYYDNTSPVCSVNITSSGTEGVTGTVTANDTGSGISGQVSYSFVKIKSTKDFSFGDKAGNRVKCSVNVSAVTEYRTRTCSQYNACASESCGLATCQTAACGYATCSACYNSCLTGSNTCTGGWKEVKGYYYQNCGLKGNSDGCTIPECYESKPVGYVRATGSGYSGSCTVSKTWNSCLTGSNTCKGGYYNCKSEKCGYATCEHEDCGFDICRTSDCGCETWNSWGDWNSTYCDSSSNCETRIVYSGS